MISTRYRPVSSRSVILRVKESQDVQDPKGIPDVYVSEHVIEQRISTRRNQTSLPRACWSLK